MSIKSDLTVLKTNIQNAKDKLFTNLTEKGVTDITTASTLDAMADSVSGITTGGGGNPFEEIGYEATPQYIQNSLEYSKQIQKEWNNQSVLDLDYISNDLNNKIIFFPLIDTSSVTSMSLSFSSYRYLQYVPPLNTSNVTDMYRMFDCCYSLTSLDLSNWDTSKVTNMDHMFYYCSGLTSITFGGSFNTSKLAYMQNMFHNCSGLTSLDLSNWDTSNVINMSFTFSACTNLSSITFGNNFGEKVSIIEGIFGDCKKLKSLDLSNWNTCNLTNIQQTISNCSGLTSLDLSNWDTSNVTNMRMVFDGCKSLTSLDLSNWNTSKVNYMNGMFRYCSGLTSLDLSSFDTSNVTVMSDMFAYCNNLSKVDGYISFKSFSSSTMSNSYLFSYSSNSSLRKITFKDIGYNTNAKQFNMKNCLNWGVNNDTITDAKQSLIDSLITYSYDRASASYPTCTVTLYTNTTTVLTSDEIAAITAKGFTIA